jgi:hypothetical protein
MQLKNYSANLTTVIANVAQSPNGYFLSSLGGYLTNLTAGSITVTLSIYSDVGALKSSVPFTLAANQRLDMSNKMFLGPLETIKAICSSGTASIVLFGAETLVSAEVVPASWNWLGAWAIGTSYVPNNLVAGADGRAYIALFSNTASEPSLINTNWGVFASSSDAVLNSDATTAAMQFVIDEDTMVSDSDTKVPTQQSVKAYVDGRVSSATNYRGGYDANTNTPNLDATPIATSIGDTYTVTVAGTFFTIDVEVGDVLIAEVTNATLESDWTILNKNTDSYIIIGTTTITFGSTATALAGLTSVTSTSVTPDWIDFPPLAPGVVTPAAGRMTWNDNDGTLDLGLKGGNVTLQIGQEMMQRVTNSTGAAIVNGTVVYVSGAVGNRLTIAKADPTTDATTNATIGVLTEDLANNGQGYATTVGLVRGIDTSAWAEGATLYLTGIGAMTTTAPTAPTNVVHLGYVVRSHATNGSIYVRVSVKPHFNGLSDVGITTPSDGDYVAYDLPTSSWKNYRSPLVSPSITGPVSITGNSLILPKTSGVGIKVEPAAPTWGWRDIIGAVIPKATGVGSPSRVIYNGGVSGEYAFTANDLVDFVFHIPHDYVPGTDIYFHIHWSHNGTAISGNAVFDVFHTYAKGHNQANFPAEKLVSVTYTTTDITTTPQYRHRIDEVIVSGATATATLMARGVLEPDGVFKGAMRLNTLPSITGGSLFVHTMDLHYQSTNMATKQKVPNFYV